MLLILLAYFAAECEIKHLSAVFSSHCQLRRTIEKRDEELSGMFSLEALLASVIDEFIHSQILFGEINQSKFVTISP